MTRWDSGELLSDAIEPSGRFPMRLVIRAPSPSELLSQFAEVQDWTQRILKAAISASLTIEWREINHRQLGRNKLPSAILISTLIEAARWLGKSRELQIFIQQSTILLRAFPKLRPWVLKNGLVLLKEKDNLARLMIILEWIRANPRPGIYLRQLSLPGIDTKFIEQYKKILADWLDLQLSLEEISAEYSKINQFEVRYGFREKPTQVRFRILDKSLYLHGLSDLTVTSEAFSRLDLAVTTVFITENDINGLVFPDIRHAIVVFGRGYGFDFFKNANWLKDKQIYYWGDIDTHGFAILNQCRHYLPQVTSLLMNKEVLLSHELHWTVESKQTQAELTHLTHEEFELYTALKNQEYGHGVRLEQEFVNFSALSKALNTAKVTEPRP